MRYVNATLSLILFLLMFPLSGQASADIHVSARNAVLIEQISGRILYEKNAHDIESIASITKIMTAIIAIESGKMNDLTKASHRAVHTEGSSIYLEQGEKMSIEDLVYGLMLRSGNDAAVSISEHVAGSVEGFVYLMNEKALWLGMTNTHFDNPHGLDSEHHYSTAYDMALLLRYAMGDEVFQEISGTHLHKASSRSYAWQNKNRLLTSIYEYCTGGKTGFTKKTGRTLSTTATKDNLNLIAVTLDGPNDWQDHMQMFEWGFENFELKPVLDSGIREFYLEEQEENVSGFINSDVQYPLSKAETNKLNYRTYILKNHVDIDDEQIGKTTIYLDEEEVLVIPVYQTSNQVRQNGFFTSLLDQFKRITGID